MTEKTRILFLSANPWTTGRILVDEEEREISKRLQEGPDRDRFELRRHAATRPVDLQRLLMMYEPHIVHFSAHGSKQQKIILGGKPGKGTQVDQDGLVKMFALYKSHVRLVVLNACFTRNQARSLSEIIDYSIGASKGIDDKEGVTFAGAFYRALSFGKSIKAAFDSATVELGLIKKARTKGLELFVRESVNESDPFFGADKGQSRAAENSAGGDLHLSADHSTGYHTQRHDGVLKHQERSDRAERRLPTFGTSTTRVSELAYKEECHHPDYALKQDSFIRRESNTWALDLTQPGDRPSHFNLATLRKAKGVKRINLKPGEHEIERSSLVNCSHTSVTLTIKVFKVALRDSRGLSQMRVARKGQARRTRASVVKKRTKGR